MDNIHLLTTIYQNWIKLVCYSRIICIINFLNCNLLIALQKCNFKKIHQLNFFLFLTVYFIKIVFQYYDVEMYEIYPG